MRRALIALTALLLCGSACAQDAIDRFHSQIISGWGPSGTYVGPPPLVVPVPPVVVTPPPVVIAPPPPPPAPPPVCAAVNYGAPLNLRTWPNGPIIGSYYPGTRVVSDGSNGGQWVHVIIGPVSGWMFAPYLVPLPCGF